MKFQVLSDISYISRAKSPTYLGTTLQDSANMEYFQHCKRLYWTMLPLDSNATNLSGVRSHYEKMWMWNVKMREFHYYYCTFPVAFPSEVTHSTNLKLNLSSYLQAWHFFGIPPQLPTRFTQSQRNGTANY